MVTVQRRVTAETASRWSHAAIALVVLASLGIQLVLIFTGGADANSGQTTGGLGLRLWRLFSYFTIQSNLFVLVTALLLVRRPARDGTVWRVVRLDALLGILITGLVFETILAPLVHLTGAAVLATIGLHYISPWAFIAAWLLFGPRPRITWGTVAAAFVWPVAWLVYIFTQGAFTRWYPYPFLDVTRLGFGEALRNALLVVAVAVVFAVLFKLVDRRLPAPLR
ncbi:Pr6Pr family membrane protein [Actinosynnema sp. CA-248983]